MSKQWAIILGCSTGHGAATALALAKEGYGIIGFHLDRGPIKKEAENLKKKIAKINDGAVCFWNENAADKDVMSKHIEEIVSLTNNQPVKLLMHSIAFGSTTNFFKPPQATPGQFSQSTTCKMHCPNRSGAA